MSCYFIFQFVYLEFFVDFVLNKLVKIEKL